MGWEDWYLRLIECSYMSDVRSYTQLAILQGTDIARCYGTATLDLNFPGMQLRAVEPKVVLLEHIPDCISLSDIIARP